MTILELISRFRGPAKRQPGGGWHVFCPAHNDGATSGRPSLSIKEREDGGILVHCFAGCPTRSVMATAGLTMAALAPPGNGPAPSARQILATYPYTDGAGAVLYEVVRYAPKDFRQRRPVGPGAYTWDLKGVPRVPYRLHTLAEEPRVFWCEGEKDADNLAALGVTATTAAGGANAWRDDYARQLADLGVREVIVLPDQDTPGLAYAQAVQRGCTAAGLSARILPLPGVPEKGDVSDWLAQGHTLADLEALLVPRETPPTPTPAPAPASDYIETLEAFLAEPDTPEAVIFPGLLPQGVLLLAHGEPRARKSLLGVELALSAATGTAPFGLARFQPAGPVPTLYLQEEDPRALTRPRLRRLAHDRVPGGVIPLLHVSVRRGVNLDDPAWVARLQGDLERLGIKLLVLDAARRLSAKTDEGPTKVRELIGVLRDLVTQTGVTIVIVHHDIKPPQNGQDLRRRSQRASGGDWFAGCECPVHVERLSPSESLVYPQDYKFSADPAPFTFSCRMDGALIARLEGVNSTPEEADQAGGRGKLLDWIKVNPMSSKTAMKKAGFGWASLTPLLEVLLREGLVDSVDNPKKRGSEVYFAVAHDASQRPGTHLHEDE